MEKIRTPLERKQIERLNVGDDVFLSGTIYTARDVVHKRLVEALHKGQRLPFDFKETIIYYCGPTKTPRGRVIGSCGPTTACRMDEFTLPLLKAGIRAMIGKGKRSATVINLIKKYKAIYFLTYAGCGALLSRYVKRAKPVAYKELGPEAIYKLEVERFPLIVGIDTKGRSIYAEK